MVGQKIRKKVKVEPSLAGGGDPEKNDGDGGGAVENPPNIAEHPLLKDSIMKVLFKQFSFLSHDTPHKSVLAHLAGLRPVCKAWNREIGKMIRNETCINVNKLISGYPNGLGWTTTTRADQNDIKFKYSAPMPEAIGTFGNLSVTIKSCDDFNNTSILKWFQVMGSSVKSLHLTCPMSCPDQNRFVEKILKKWCPNLESFTLRGVKCFETLVQNSFFAEPSLENQCSSLKEFVFYFDGLDMSQWSQFCGLRIKGLEGPTNKKIPTVAVRKKIHEKRFEFVDDLVDYVDLGVDPWPGLSLDKQLQKLLKRQKRPIGLTSLEGMTKRTYGSHVAPFFQEKFSCNPGYENDGGIFAQLMNMSKVDKFVAKNADQQWFFYELFTLPYFRPNLWKSSLQQLEFFDGCPPATALKLFARFGFPFKKLKFGGGFLLFREANLDPKEVERILRNCSETLEELEIGASDFSRQLILPTLPELKVLVLESNGDREVRLTCHNILKKLPNLEKCVVKRSGRRGGSSAGFFGGGDKSWLDLETNHPLKELKLLDEYVNKKDIERMVRVLPNLKVLSISIVQESEDFKAFWEKLGELPLEQVKVSFSVKSGRDTYENAIVDHVKGFKELRWLELVNKAKQPFPLTSRLSKGLAKATRLRVLKFTNFEVGGNDSEEIKKNLAHIAFQLQLPPALVSARSVGRRLKKEKKT